MNAYLIRRMKDEDVLAVVHVDAIAGILMPWSPNAYWGELRKKTTWCWVAESITDEELEYRIAFCMPIDDVKYAAGELIVIGSVTMWRADYKFHIANIAVHPDFAGQGAGQALMEKAISGARGRGAAQLWLEVRESNARARRMYERFGFAAQGTRSGAYSNGEAAVSMSLPITPQPLADARAKF